MLELLAQHDAADEDKPRHRECEEAGNQPAAKAEELCLAGVVELIPLCDGGCEAGGCNACGSALRQPGGAGVGNGFRDRVLRAVPEGWCSCGHRLQHRLEPGLDLFIRDRYVALALILAPGLGPRSPLGMRHHGQLNGGVGAVLLKDAAENTVGVLGIGIVRREFVTTQYQLVAVDGGLTRGLSDGLCAEVLEGAVDIRQHRTVLPRFDGTIEQAACPSRPDASRARSR